MKMSKQEFNERIKTGKHRFSYCPLCNYPTIICGHCGNSTCNGGSGEPCIDKCEEAYLLAEQNMYPLRLRVRYWIDSHVYSKLRWIKLQYDNIKYDLTGK